MGAHQGIIREMMLPSKAFRDVADALRNDIAQVAKPTAHRHSSALVRRGTALLARTDTNEREEIRVSSVSATDRVPPARSEVHHNTCGCTAPKPNSPFMCQCMRPVRYHGDICGNCKKGWHTFPV